MKWNERIADKRLIFTVATGRCGTGFLAAALRWLPGVDCFHEAAPDFVSAMRTAQHEPEHAVKFLISTKLPAIEACPAPVYIETSHLFCKGFAEPLWDLEVPFDLLHIHRPHREVALSLFRLNTIPGRTPAGVKYTLQPNDPGVLTVENWQSLTDYQLCYWYCLEIARRANGYLQRAEQYGGKTYRTSLADVSRPGGVQQVVKALELDLPKGWARLRWALAQRKRVNKRRWLRHAPQDTELDRLEIEVERRIETSAELRQLVAA